MALARTARGVWKPLLVAAAALSVALTAGREASRRIDAESASMEVLSSGLDRLTAFVGDIVYLKIDDYHHIWMYQGHGWQTATDYLPMVWLVSRLKPHYARNYIDGGYHIAVNLGQVEEGVRFLRRGRRMCPDDPGVAWELAVVLWRTGHGTPRMRQEALWSYLDMLRRLRGRTDSPWNEPNALMVLREVFEADSSRRGSLRISALYNSLCRNRRAVRNLERALER
jgi:hypothetical protein